MQSIEIGKRYVTRDSKVCTVIDLATNYFPNMHHISGCFVVRRDYNFKQDKSKNKQGMYVVNSNGQVVVNFDGPDDLIDEFTEELPIIGYTVVDNGWLEKKIYLKKEEATLYQSQFGGRVKRILVSEIPEDFDF